MRVSDDSSFMLVDLTESWLVIQFHASFLILVIDVDAISYGLSTPISDTQAQAQTTALYRDVP